MLSELSENYCASSCRARAHPNVCLAPRPPSQGRSLYWRLADGLIREIRLPGNTQDGRTLRTAIEDTEELRDRQIERAYVDKAYRSHDTANPHRVFISGQKRGVFGVIKRELRRRSAIEAVIGHMKTDGHLGRCYLKGRAGDAGRPGRASGAGRTGRTGEGWRAELCDEPDGERKDQDQQQYNQYLQYLHVPPDPAVIRMWMDALSWPEILVTEKIH